MAEEPTSEQSILRRKVTKSRTKKKKGSKSQESTLDKSLLRRTTGRSQKGDFIFSSLDDRLSSGEVDVSSFPSASQSGSVSGAVSTREDTDINILQQPSVSSPLGSSVSSDRQLKRSDASEEIEEAEKIEEHVGSPRDELISLTSGSISPSVAVMETGIQTSEEAVVELKQRRLQRSKQVVSDRFDEWEDAFRRENEQRKVDEIFMREALAEAIKAADSWEVPVGAVVVQNGKIIARGYNLVEELRDSTAHAEMICIREASNVLRSWRLSDTTLYVTLEPCPMCAGAILQARIKTLVWGAPNKLLGADGSWIRLFPEGAEGGERSEVAEKPAAPPHPFHPNMNIRRGVLEPECAQIMQQFFQLRRKKEKAKVKKSEEEDQPSCLPVQHSPTKLLRKMHGIFHSL